MCVCVHMCAQLCLTLCDPMDCSPPGLSVHGIFHARVQSGLPFLTLGNLVNPGIESKSLGSSALAGGFFYHRTPREGISYRLICLYNSGSSHPRN